MGCAVGTGAVPRGGGQPFPGSGSSSAWAHAGQGAGGEATADGSRLRVGSVNYCIPPTPLVLPAACPPVPCPPAASRDALTARCVVLAEAACPAAPCAAPPPGGGGLELRHPPVAAGAGRGGGGGCRPRRPRERAGACGVRAGGSTGLATAPDGALPPAPADTRPRVANKGPHRQHVDRQTLPWHTALAGTGAAGQRRRLAGRPESTAAGRGGPVPSRGERHAPNHPDGS